MFSKLFGGNKGGGVAKAEAFISALKSQLGIDDAQATSIESYMRDFFQARKQSKQEGNKDGMQTARNLLMENI